MNVDSLSAAPEGGALEIRWDISSPKTILRALESLAELEKALEITTPTANSLIKALMEKKILTEITGQQRGRVYASERYLKLFVS